MTGTVAMEELANTGFPWGYTHAPFVSEVPVGAVSGTWTFNTNHFVAGNAAKTSNVTRVFISVDPNFHNPDDEFFRGAACCQDGRTPCSRACALPLALASQQ
jgi:hypothetical protein